MAACLVVILVQRATEPSATIGTIIEDAFDRQLGRGPHEPR